MTNFFEKTLLGRNSHPDALHRRCFQRSNRFPTGRGLEHGSQGQNGRIRCRTVRRLTINVAAAGCLSILFLDSVALSQDQTPEEKVAITKECNGTKLPEIIEDSITLKKTAYLRPRVLVVEASDGFTFAQKVKLS